MKTIFQIQADHAPSQAVVALRNELAKHFFNRAHVAEMEKRVLARTKRQEREYEAIAKTYKVVADFIQELEIR